MSIFQSEAIVLHIKKIWDKDFLYTLFSKDYGKIRCTKKIWKSEKPLDIWYCISFEISTQTKSTIHKIRNLKILSEFIPNQDSFGIIHSYLELFALISKQLPDWLAHKEIYNLLKITHSLEKNYEDIFLLLSLKAQSYFWNLGDTHNNTTVQKILRFIHTSQIQKIICLNGITPELKKELKACL